MEETKEIKFEKRTRKEWLKDMPDVIYRLVYGYRFYFCRPYLGYSKISSEISDFVIKKYKDKRHCISLYVNKTGTQWYLVVYAKNKITIYYTNEYSPTENWGNIKRFIKKFSTAADKANEERAWNQLSSQTSDNLTK